jgi:hypothetical protein
MPDGDPSVIAASTRRELKSLIIDEANMLSTEDTVGFSKRAIAAFAAECWREAQKAKPAYLPYCLPCKERAQSNYSYGIFVSVASRQEYLDYQAEME